MAAANSGVSTLTADSCAGCHRAHTAQGAYLLNAPNDEDLCLTCHGAAGTGATTDVMTGVQYRVGVTGLRTGTQLGALRAGGFDQARIGDPFKIGLTSATGTLSAKAKIQVGPAADVTSVHIAMPANGNVLPGIAWGNGANGSGVGPAATVSCTSCHNPHGNGQYRILNPIPATTGVNAAWTASVVDVTAATGVYRTAASHGLLVGDNVTVAGSSSASANTTAVVATLVGTNGFTLTGVTVAANGTGGTVTRNGGVKVVDAALPAAGDVRNYTVIQTPTSAGYLLYASQVVAGGYTATQGDYWHRQTPWNAVTGSNDDAPNGIPATSGATIGFNDQITVWCSQCHTRYMANQNPTTNPANGTVANSWGTPRAGDSIYAYQHRTRPNRACTTCHVAHGSNAAMTGTYSSQYAYPGGTILSPSSRLLKVGNRGTCQMCHDPTGTFAIGDQYPPTAPVPGTP